MFILRKYLITCRLFIYIYINIVIGEKFKYLCDIYIAHN